MAIIQNFMQRQTGNQWAQYGLTNAAAGSAGASVAVNVLSQDNVLPASAQYSVEVELSVDATAYITAKTASGFTVNIQPRLAAVTLAAGTFNVGVYW